MGNESFIGNLAYEITSTFQKGEMISGVDWLYPRLDAVNPYVGSNKHSKFDFYRNQLIGSLRESLAEDYLYWLDLSNGGRYKLLKAYEHEGVASDYLQAGIRKAFSAAGRVIASTDKSSLTNEQMKAYNDTAAAIGSFQKVVNSNGRNVWGDVKNGDV